MKKIVKEITERLSRLPSVAGILLTGSYARKIAYQDIDLLVLIEELSVEDFISTVMREFRHLSTFFDRSDDALQFPVKDSHISIAVHQSGSFRAYINGFVAGFNIDVDPKVWAIGGRLPEVVCFDVVTGMILFDPMSVFKDLQSQLRSYPLLTKKALIEKCYGEIKHRLSFVENKKDMLSSLLAGNELLMPLIRLMFVRNEMFLPGTKRLLDDIRFCFGDSEELKLVEEIVSKQSMLHPLVISKIHDFLNNLEREGLLCTGQIK